MEQSRLKLRISRMFRSTFGIGSCRTRNTSDEKALFASRPLMTSPKPRPFPSICRPEPGRPVTTRSHTRVSGEPLRRRTKVCVSDRHSPVSPLDFYSVSGKKNRKNSKRRGFSGEIRQEVLPFSSSSGWWLSSDDGDGDDETETLFSSRTLSSDSSESRRRRSRRHRRNREVGIEVSAGKVDESFAVVKSSSDPYGDFRASMVEMIVEKQMFGAEDLENLLQCFLSLNSRQHHEIIVHVFTEIWEALFCNWS